ncbi:MULTISPECIES: UbiA family prenyltransferase [Haloferax]|nr:MULTISPECIES: UbiA family prenyltransferase [Haloferax]MDS0243662.1 UbiA family prenyltransferase [Haloferax sp. S2CR25]MDS0446783.1 UbiA family prenyltransferase [Haloferax sp. S2CR25-2]
MRVADARFLFFQLNIWLCLLSAAMVAISGVAMGVDPRSIGGGLLLAPLLFYFIYVEDRRGGTAEDEINQPHRTRLVRRYQTELLATELLALLGYELVVCLLVFQTATANVSDLLFAQVPLVVLGSYGWLKRYPTLDSIGVGFTWAFVAVFSVVAATHQQYSLEGVAVFFGWFLITAAGVESRNIQDITGDTRANKTTLAGYLGPRTASLLVRLLKAGGVVVFWVVSGTFVAGLVLCYLLALSVFRRLTRLHRRNASSETGQHSTHG